ncbi:ABC transporter permease subunit [Fimbriiglobus ruber]|uniref:ABC-2 type transporter transmembrane domain-containing protein n=1 Tax=Fimbriiglobus ruber TaxID=1908690 RepID=A0A225D404_9BACT|nr:ABC transporter permease subunit [Fimbriiglobus ruber]OWK36232.1 hypothetical protein FRUB_08795 [Fimbriiglobus ruber]
MANGTKRDESRPDRAWLPWTGFGLWVVGAVGLGYLGRYYDRSPGELVLAGTAWVGVLGLAARESVRYMFGPVFTYEIVRLGRRWFTFAIRLFYVLCVMALLGMMFFGWLKDIGYFDGRSVVRVPPGRLSSFATNFFYTFIVVQFCVVVFLTPAYVAGTVADEKERKTLEFLLATDLRNREIIFGKLAARVTVLLMFVLAGLPVIAFLQLFGGIDPDQVLAATAATILTILGLSALGLAFSTALRRPRDAITMTYLAAALFAIISFALPAIARAYLSRSGYPTFSVLGYELNYVDVTDWFGAGNIFYVVVSILELSGGMSPAAIGAALLRYGIFWGLATALLLGYSVWRLRTVALHQSYGAPRGVSGWRARRRAARVRPAVGSDPIFWKEVHAESGGCGGLAGRVMVIFIICLVFIFPIVGFFAKFGDLFGIYRAIFNVPLSSESLQERWRDFAQVVSVWVRMATGGLGFLAMLGAAIRGAGVVSGERDKDTWVSLISTPLTAWEILRGKWLGCLLGLRPLYYALLLTWLLALAVGAVKLPMLVLTAVATAVYVSGFAWVGIFCSVAARNTLIATVRALIASIFLAGGFWVFCGLCCAAPIGLLSRSQNPDFLPGAAQFLLGCTPPFVAGWLPLNGYQDRDLVPFPWDARHGMGPLAPLFGVLLWVGFNFGLCTAALRAFESATNRTRNDPADSTDRAGAKAADIQRTREGG